MLKEKKKKGKRLRFMSKVYFLAVVVQHSGFQHLKHEMVLQVYAVRYDAEGVCRH